MEKGKCFNPFGKFWHIINNNKERFFISFVLFFYNLQTFCTQKKFYRVIHAVYMVNYGVDIVRKQIRVYRFIRSKAKKRVWVNAYVQAFDRMTLILHFGQLGSIS